MPQYNTETLRRWAFEENRYDTARTLLHASNAPNPVSSEVRGDLQRPGGVVGAQVSGLDQLGRTYNGGGRSISKFDMLASDLD